MKLKRRSFTCTDEEWAELVSTSEQTGLSISQIIRINLGFMGGMPNEEITKKRTDNTDTD